MDALTRSWGYRAAAEDLVAGRPDAAWLAPLLREITQRQAGCERAILVVEKLLLSSRGWLPEQRTTAITNALVGFRYRFDDPGPDDGVNRWSEHRQLMFLVAEYLAGQLYPDRRFAVDDRLGSEKQARAGERLRTWLDERFVEGFSEWLSPVPYEAAVAALCLLIDYADDDELVTRAAIVCDLVLLDLALHRFEGRFVASGGRVSREQKMAPGASHGLGSIMDIAFGHPPRFVPDQLSSIFLDRARYQIPDVLVEIAQASGIHRIRTCHGTDVHDLVRRARHEGATRDESSRDALVARLWGREAFITKDSIDLTLAAVQRIGPPHAQIEAQLSPCAKFGGGPMARASVGVRNPVTQGMALEHAKVHTYRTPDYLLSSTQRYRPGGFGHQESVWVACLPGAISVFSTHPGAPSPSETGRPSNPSEWVGNGILPDVAQQDNVALVLHDLRSRPGLSEGSRQWLSHLHFPFPSFDETWLSDTVVAARRGDAYIAVAGVRPLEMVSNTELVQRGRVTGWAVMLTDRAEYARLEDFTAALETFRLEYQRGRLRWEVARTAQVGEPRSRHCYQLVSGGRFEVDDAVVSDRYPRYDCDWVTMPRGASRVEIKGHSKTLVLDWEDASRREVITRP